MKISAAVLALPKIAPLAQAEQPGLSATPGRHKTPAPPRLWISYRLSLRRCVMSRWRLPFSCDLRRARFNSRLRSRRRILASSPVRILALPVTESVALPPICGEALMTQSQGLSSAIPPAPFERPTCPRCKAPMMLVSIEPERPGVDLDTFQCAVCNHVLTTLAAHEDPMHSKALGRWLLGDLHPPR